MRTDRDKEHFLEIKVHTSALYIYVVLAVLCKSVHYCLLKQKSPSDDDLRFLS